MNIIECEQRSKEWLTARCGLVTSSKIADIYSKRKRRTRKSDDPETEAPLPDLAARIKCMDAMVYEVRTGLTAEHYVSKWMERGIDQEEAARLIYEAEMDIDVQTVGFVLHPRIRLAGCSPDGLVGEDGGVEIKVPAPTTHYNYLWNKAVPARYYLQIQWCMACCERPWWDFMSALPEPKIPRKDKSLIIRVHRDDNLIREMEDAAERFLDEVEERVKALKERTKEV